MTPALLSVKDHDVTSLRALTSASYVEIFFKIIPFEFWKELAASVNAQLVLKYKGTIQNPLKATTAGELIRFYGIFYQTFSNVQVCG